MLRAILRRNGPTKFVETQIDDADVPDEVAEVVNSVEFAVNDRSFILQLAVSDLNDLKARHEALGEQVEAMRKELARLKRRKPAGGCDAISPTAFATESN